MRQFFEEYGGVIIVGVVIIALVAMVGILMKTDGVVQTAFMNLINSLLSKAGVPNVTAAFPLGSF